MDNPHFVSLTSLMLDDHHRGINSHIAGQYWTVRIRSTTSPEMFDDDIVVFGRRQAERLALAVVFGNDDIHVLSYDKLIGLAAEEARAPNVSVMVMAGWVCAIQITPSYCDALDVDIRPLSSRRQHRRLLAEIATRLS